MTLTRFQGGLEPWDIKHFVNFSELSIADMEAWKDAGGKIAGVYCIYAPTEVIRAAGVAPVSLCGKKQDPIKEAERELPPSLCPLIKSSYGYAVNGTCPFFSASDVLVAETTCDGKKKMYELMGRLKPLHLMHLPHTQVGGAALEYWLHAQRDLAAFLTDCSGVAVTEDALRAQIAEQNAIRAELSRVAPAGRRRPLAPDRRGPAGRAGEQELLRVSRKIPGRADRPAPRPGSVPCRARPSGPQRPARAAHRLPGGARDRTS